MSEIVRTITVFNQNTQEKTVIENVYAETFGELKDVLREHGIHTEGMDVREGISRIDLKSDGALLPHDTPYRGTTTNDLMILLTKTNKNIASGIGRTEAVQYMKDNELQDAIQKTFGKNWTNVATADLVSFVENHIASSKTPEFKCDSLAKAVKALTDDLYENDYISDYAYERINALLNGKGVDLTPDKGFSQDEIYSAIRNM